MQISPEELAKAMPGAKKSRKTTVNFEDRANLGGLVEEPEAETWTEPGPVEVLPELPATPLAPAPQAPPRKALPRVEPAIVRKAEQVTVSPAYEALGMTDGEILSLRHDYGLIGMLRGARGPQTNLIGRITRPKEIKLGDLEHYSVMLYRIASDFGVLPEGGWSPQEAARVAIQVWYVRWARQVEEALKAKITREQFVDLLPTHSDVINRKGGPWTSGATTPE